MLPNRKIRWDSEFVDHRNNYPSHRDYPNISNAEGDAIYKSIIICLENNWKNNLMITDSKNSIDRLKNNQIKINNYITLEIEKVLMNK